MNGRNHALLGAVTTFSYLLLSEQTVYYVGWVPFGVGMLVGTAAALLPDIDTPDNHLRRTLGVGNRQTTRAILDRRRRGMFLRLGNFLRWLVARLLNVVAWTLPHRGLTHWLVTAVVLTLLAAAFTRSQGLPDLFWETFGIGYLSHILADVCTEAGVKLFAPVYNRAITIPFLRVRTGTWTEQLFVYFLLFLWLVWLSYRYLL